MASSSYSLRSSTPWGLKIAIVGAGPSGILLAHRLASSKLPLNQIDIYEYRSDPRSDATRRSSGRGAYALGLGIRGQTAIRAVDNELLTAVKRRGLECERFRLHLTSNINIKLRDGKDSSVPSILIYQTDLCSALLDELERRAYYEDVVSLHFDTTIADINLASSTLTLGERDGVDANNVKKGPYDLIVGCDGANSIVRDAIYAYSPPNTFSFTQRQLLPGCFKVARADRMPPLLDPGSVALILPEKKSLGVTAFVEPTIAGGACILFAGRLASTVTESDDKDVDLSSFLFPNPDVSHVQDSASSQPNIATMTKLIIEQFPLLDGMPGLDDIVQQLLSQRTSVATSVKCNTYNSNSDVTPVAICGDAAHATGGVSGQGANSALMDTTVLAECLIQCYVPPSTVSSSVVDEDVSIAKRALLHQSVSAYSKRAVPEGLALYDLSFGNDGKTLPIFRNIQSILSNIVDTLFRGRLGIGKKTLQTLLSSSLTSFVEIRRDRESMYVENFPSDIDFQLYLDRVYSGLVNTTTTASKL